MYSNRTLLEVAILWGESWDKKYDYKTNKRHLWKGKEVQETGSIPHTQELMVKEVEGYISIDFARTVI